MAITLTFAVILVLILTSVIYGISVVYPLFAGLVLLAALSVRKGFKLSEVIKMIFRGGVKSLLVIRIFVLIGAIISMWMAGGTLGFIVYYGIKLIHPTYFVLSAFIITSAVSFLLGTSFGTIGTIGVTLMVMAKSGNVDINVAAGAIIAGAYFGDRCSPMSSSANLVAVVTDTDLFRNLKNMLRTTIIPFILAMSVYAYLSAKNPLKLQDNKLLSEITEIFNISPWVSVPAVIMLLLVLFKVDVKLSMLISIVAAAFSGILLQHKSLTYMLKVGFFGFDMGGNHPLSAIIRGGGILSMIKISIIVFISSAYSGIFEETGLLKEAEAFVEKAGKRHGNFAIAFLTAIAASCFGATQTLAIILTNQLVKRNYEREEGGKYDLAVTLENTAVVIAPLIPWNIAGAVPASALSVGYGYIIYACYLYLIPIINLAFYKRHALYKIRF